MSSTSKIPNVSVGKFKRTKIIATIGPATDSYEMVLAMAKAGVNGFRLNCSHGTDEQRTRHIEWIRKASNEYGKPVAIILDLQGPKIRLGEFDGIINVRKGQSLALKHKADYERSGYIPTQYDLAKKVKRGERLLIADGSITTIVTSISGGIVNVRSENEGVIIRNKGINLPDTDFEGDIITAKDKRDLAFGSMHDIDFVAQSFVQTGKDVEKLRKILRNLSFKAKIIAKVETKSAVENIEDIVVEADSIMVARGDLASETPAESVPVVQRNIVGLGMRHSKPTIIATQMLLSMTDNPEPTRAEVSDIASSVIIGADSVMLSEETASGKYPIRSIEVMKKVIKYTQDNLPLKVQYPEYSLVPSMRDAICDAVISLSDSIKAKAIVAETATGQTAINLSARRPNSSIIAVTSDQQVANQLSIVFGIKSYVRPVDAKAATKLANWLRKNKIFSTGDIIVTASGKHPGVVGATDTIKVRMLD
ncbi:pyruvate kinase [Candidatus Saccharibacteria bacterium]|nr:pyruvate kinase [Candidatus Saccharibacteria bacterium]